MSDLVRIFDDVPPPDDGGFSDAVLGRVERLERGSRLADRLLRAGLLLAALAVAPVVATLLRELGTALGALPRVHDGAAYCMLGLAASAVLWMARPPARARG